MSYSEKLKDPRWQKKRLKIMEYAKFRCQMCGAKDRTLHVHHSYYVRNKAPWQYPDGSLICICEDCHGIIHPQKKKEIYNPAPQYTPEEIEEMNKPVADEGLKDRFGSIFAALGRVSE